MTSDMILVNGVLVLAILMFIFEWVRVDVVGIIMMVILPLLGLVTPQQAISGLSSNAVVSIIAVIIIGAGLDKTGVMNSLARLILKFAGKSESRIIALISGTVAFISSFMQNIGAAALFMPAVRRIARQTGIPVSRVLMPMGFCAIIGGCITLVGSSPLILLNDLMKVVGDYQPFGLFSVTPLGLALTAAGIFYFIFLGKLILPAKGTEESSGPLSSLLAQTYGEIANLFELHIPQDFKEQSLKTIDLRPNYFCTVVAIARADTGQRVFAPVPDELLKPGDIIAVVGPKDMVANMAQDMGWELKQELEFFAEELSPNNAGIMEAIVTPRSKLAGHTLRSFEFRRRFGVNPLAIFRGDKLFVSGLLC